MPKKPKDTNNEIAGAKRERDQAHADYQNIRSKCFLIAIYRKEMHETW